MANRVYEIQMETRAVSMNGYGGWVTLHRVEEPVSGAATGATVLRLVDGLRAAARQLNRVANVRVVVDGDETAL